MKRNETVNETLNFHLEKIIGIEGTKNYNGHKALNTLYTFHENPLEDCDDAALDHEQRRIYANYKRTIPPYSYLIFTITNLKGTETGWVLEDSEAIRAGLIGFILNKNEGKRLFYIDTNGKSASTDRRNKNDEKVRLIDVVYSLYYGVEVDQAKALHARMINRKAKTAQIPGGEKIRLLWLTKDNIISDTIKSVCFSNGAVYHDDRTLGIAVGGRRFETQFDEGLSQIITAINQNETGSWELDGKGALNALLYGKNSKRIRVSFGEIVGEYWRGRLATEDGETIISALIQRHIALMGEHIVYDHLTHNKLNNYPWALMPVTEAQNKKLQRRDTVKPPYFFFTVCDWQTGEFRVKCGISGQWERRYLFRAEDTELYVALYNAFRNRIGKAHKGAKEESLLSYWADNERAHDAENPLTAMLKESKDSYITAAIEAAFDDMPIPETEGEANETHEK